MSQTLEDHSYNPPMPRKRHGTAEPIDPFSARVGEFIDDRLKALDWDQKQLAVKMGISQSMLSRLLAGTSKFTLEYLDGASLALDIPVARLVYASLEPSRRASQEPTTTQMSGLPVGSPVGLNEWLGDKSDDITPRERRWLESIRLPSEEGTETPEFWDGILAVFRGRK